MDRDPNQQPTDVELMLRFREEGEVAAFAQLMQRHRPVVLGFIARQMGDTEVVAELYRETFLHAHTSVESWTEPQPVATWLLTIAANLCRGHRRRREEGTTSALAMAAVRYQVEGMSAAQAQSARENHRIVERALDQLTDAQREVAVLHLFSGLDRATISDVLQLPETTVKARFTTALYRLLPTLENLRVERS